MCGIAGKVYTDRQRPVEPDVLAAMAQSIEHRGPDDDGVYRNQHVGLTMRRLSVIDLGGGKQPIHNEDRTIWTVYNGEIYNYLELRKDLEARGHRFYTHADTEVIVHLYEEYGVDFPRYLNGMFAIALWDENAERLVLARDHVGIKPLHYSVLPDRLLFGSEIKAMLADRPHLTLDVNALSIYLSVLYIPAPYTIYREIRKLEAGHSLVWHDGKVSIQQFWNLSSLTPFDDATPSHELQEQLRTLLADAVKRQLIADVPVGIFLSGGLDSSTVVAYARQASTGPIKTFSIGFDDPSYDETDDARRVARFFETDHTELTVRPDATDLIPKLVAAFDEPFADSSAIPVYYLSQLTRQHVTVALGGDGGDELFAGYVTYQADKYAEVYNRLPGALSRNIIPGLVRLLPVSDRKVSFDLKARRFVANALLEQGRRHYAWKAFFADDLKQGLLAPDLVVALNGDVDSYSTFNEHYNDVTHMDPIGRFQYVDAKVYLPDDILVKVDRTSMAHSLEARVPLLDYRLVEFAFKLPDHRRMPGFKLKHFLRQAVRDVLPPEVFTKRKGGFNVPMSGWLKTELRSMVTTYLAPEVVRSQGYFRPEAVDRLVQDHMTGRADNSRNVWALLMFSRWAEQAKLHV